MQNLPKIGSVNAAHVATVLDADKKTIGYCMDTPNNAAYALSINNKAEYVATPFNGIYTRKELEKRFHGLDASFHSKYVKFI